MVKTGVKMPLLWDVITINTREQLCKYQWRCHRKKLLPPDAHDKAVTVTGKVEDLEEIDRIMRQLPKWRQDK